MVKKTSQHKSSASDSNINSTASPSQVSFDSCNNHHGNGNHVSLPSNDSSVRSPHATTRTPICRPPPAPKDDLDLLLLHQDFSVLLNLASQVKRLRQIIADVQRSRGADAQVSSSFAPQSFRKSGLKPDEILGAVTRLHQRLLSQAASLEKQHAERLGSDGTIPRGVYPITDSVMDDSLSTLQAEINHCQKHLSTLQNDEPIRSTLKETSVSGGQTASKTKGKQNRCVPKKAGDTTKKRKNKKDAIAVKYAKWQTDILMKWMIQNIQQPFPDQQAIASLTESTGLSSSQIVNWTTNVRKRNRKATCEGGKKPHHFLDFLFLKQDQERKRQEDEANGIATKDQSVARDPTKPDPLGSDSLEGFSSVANNQMAPVGFHYPNSNNYLISHNNISKKEGDMHVHGEHEVPKGLILGRDPRVGTMLFVEDDEGIDMTFDSLNDLDPLGLEEEPDDDLLRDFAQVWLEDTDFDYLGDSSIVGGASFPEEDIEPPSVEDFIDESTPFITHDTKTDILTTETMTDNTNTDRLLVPSVTLDSHDGSFHGHDHRPAQRHQHLHHPPPGVNPVEQLFFGKQEWGPLDSSFPIGDDDPLLHNATDMKQSKTAEGEDIHSWAAAIGVDLEF